MTQPAFPAHHFDLAPDEHGLTVLDYFAAKAMQALIATPIDDWPHELESDSCADAAYEMADAMMQERARRIQQSAVKPMSQEVPQPNPEPCPRDPLAE